MWYIVVRIRFYTDIRLHLEKDNAQEEGARYSTPKSDTSKFDLYSNVVSGAFKTDIKVY